MILCNTKGGILNDPVLLRLVGDAPAQLPCYGLMCSRIGGRDVVISRTGFSGEDGYEVSLARRKGRRGRAQEA